MTFGKCNIACSVLQIRFHATKKKHMDLFIFTLRVHYDCIEISVDFVFNSICDLIISIIHIKRDGIVYLAFFYILLYTPEIRYLEIGLDTVIVVVYLVTSSRQVFSCIN